MSRLEKFGMPKDDRFKREKFQEIAPRCEKISRGTCAMALVWGGAACYNGHRVGGDSSVIGFIAQLGTKKINSAKAWTSDEDERLRKLIISNAPAFDIAEELGRTVTAVITRAQSLGIPRGSSRFRMKAKGK